MTKEEKRERQEIEKIYHTFVDDDTDAAIRQWQRAHEKDPTLWPPSTKKHDYQESYDSNGKPTFTRRRFPGSSWLSVSNRNWVQIVYQSLLLTPYAKNGGLLRFMQELDKARANGVNYVLLLKAGIIAGFCEETKLEIEKHEIEWKKTFEHHATIQQRRNMQYYQLESLIENRIELESPCVLAKLLYAILDLDSFGNYFIKYALHPRIYSLLRDFETNEDIAAYERKWSTLEDWAQQEFAYLSPEKKRQLEEKIKNKSAIRCNTRGVECFLNSEFPSHCKKMFENEKKWLTEKGYLSEQFSMIFDNNPFWGRSFSCWHIDYVQRDVPADTKVSPNKNGESTNTLEKDPFFEKGEHFAFLVISQRKLLYPKDTNVYEQLHNYLKQTKKRQKRKEDDKKKDDEMENEESEFRRLKNRYYNFVMRAYHTKDVEGMYDKDIGSFDLPPTPRPKDTWHFYLDCPCVDKNAGLCGLLYYNQKKEKYYLLKGGILYKYEKEDEEENPCPKDVLLFLEQNIKKEKITEETSSFVEYAKVPSNYQFSPAPSEDKDSQEPASLDKDDEQEDIGVTHGLKEQPKRSEPFAVPELLFQGGKRISRESTRKSVSIYVVQEKIEVKSPSFAAHLVSGYVRNGRKCWKNYWGKSIEDLNLPTCKHQKKKRKEEEPKPRKSKSK